eukprot:6984723-Pyramimonas_sp.AAC.1
MRLGDEEPVGTLEGNSWPHKTLFTKANLLGLHNGLVGAGEVSPVGAAEGIGDIFVIPNVLQA